MDIISEGPLTIITLTEITFKLTVFFQTHGHLIFRDSKQTTERLCCSSNKVFKSNHIFIGRTALELECRTA